VGDDLLGGLIGHVRWVAFDDERDEDANDRGGPEKGAEAFDEVLQLELLAPEVKTHSPPIRIKSFRKPSDSK